MSTPTERGVYIGVAGDYWINTGTGIWIRENGDEWINPFEHAPFTRLEEPNE